MSPRAAPVLAMAAIRVRLPAVRVPAAGAARPFSSAARHSLWQGGGGGGYAGGAGGSSAAIGATTTRGGVTYTGHNSNGGTGGAGSSYAGIGGGRLVTPSSGSGTATTYGNGYVTPDWSFC